ncbi:glycosyltransferase family 2 protein [Arenibaculum sp.]|jgi:glycosyltransferase involved in cell wall biosynthesis|uniref:glycosyltransferase family 2 protein n=1 Tax=Arenibaculum sp. TaxID=2865862 RepID=UPI002E13BC64|nr:glycosyltransferase family 2 protein [Arenibaculum sp.]
MHQTHGMVEERADPASPDAGRGSRLVSVVVPVYNERDGIAEFHRRLAAVLDRLPHAGEIVYVNDGSTDGSLAALLEIRAADGRAAVIDLSRNFGKEVAMTAGIDHARGDAVVVIDADLQDPPELIPELLRWWEEEGYDVVYARRESRAGETALKKLTSYLFYRVIGRLSRVDLPPDSGDFRVLSRRAVDGLMRVREQHRYMKGLFSWIGYRQKAVSYRREPRHAGKTKWNYVRLWNFSLEAITSFSVLPLKVATYLGLLVALFAFCYGGLIIFRTLAFGSDVPGYPSIMVVVLLLGGIQLTFIGVLGEYVARIFGETKQRPLYLIQDIHESSPTAGSRPVDGRRAP